MSGKLNDTLADLERERAAFTNTGNRSPRFEEDDQPFPISIQSQNQKPKNNNQQDYSKQNNSNFNNQKQFVQDKIGSASGDFKKSIEKIWTSLKKLNFNKKVIVTGLMLIGSGILWGLCCWSFALTAKQYGMQINANDPIQLITKEFGLALLFVLGYIGITAFEISFFLPNATEEYSGFMLGATQVVWFIAAGMDFGGVFTIVNIAINKLDVFIWFFNINFPDNDWWVLIIKLAITLILVFGVETLFVNCWEAFIKALNTKSNQRR